MLGLLFAALASLTLGTSPTPADGAEGQEPYHHRFDPPRILLILEWPRVDSPLASRVQWFEDHLPAHVDQAFRKRHFVARHGHLGTAAGLASFSGQKEPSP